MTANKSKPTSQKTDSGRQERLAQALRDNLRRRKGKPAATAKQQPGGSEIGSKIGCERED